MIMTELLNLIIESPLYVVLFGSGGILVVIVAIVSIIFQRKKKDKVQNNITVSKSKGTEIKNNELDNRSIKVEKSEDTSISGNK